MPVATLRVGGQGMKKMGTRSRPEAVIAYSYHNHNPLLAFVRCRMRGQYLEWATSRLAHIR